MKPALLLVDLQNDFLQSVGLQPDAASLINQAGQLLATCRARNIPVLHLWTTLHRESDLRLPHWKKNDRWQCVLGTAGHATPARLQPASGEPVIHKTGFNAFENGELETALRKLGCDTVLIAGLHLHACVRTAAVESLERGFTVLIAEPAVASNDPTHAAATRRWLAERCVNFAGSQEICAQLDGFGKPELIHRSPRLGSEILFEIPLSAPEQIAAAAGAARAASLRWRNTAVVSRLTALENFAARLEAAAGDLARRLALEIGKPVSHAREEIQRAAANVRDVTRRAARFEFARREPAGMVRHAPLGVVALISPWNNPIAIPVGKIAPALAYGNAVVWKPAPAAMRISQKLLHLLQESGIAEVIQLLSGDHTTAQALADNKNIDVVTLTSAAPAGHAIQEICTRRGIALQAELSGNNAAIVWDDADFAHAARQVAWGAFGFAGQRCTANRRVIVSRASYEKFLDELKKAGEQMVWGDPLAAATDIGPVISVGKRDEISAAIANAESDGAAQAVIRLQEKTAAQPWVAAGAYAQPVIVCCDQPAHSIVQEEAMAPLLVVQRAQDFDHALELCNGVRHGLAAALFSESAALQEKFLDAAQAGILKFNTSTAGADIALPFGGWKASGIGPPEHGEADRLFYTRIQTVYGAAEP